MKELPQYPGDLVEHLRAFRALAQRVADDPRGAYEAAARTVGVDPSVLRRRVQTLADYYGEPLFEGRGASLRLSAAGDSVSAGAERVFDALTELRADAGAAPRRLTFACTGTITTELLPDVIRDLEGAYPQLSVRVRRAGASAARELLESGAADLAVVRADAAPVGVDALELCGDRLWLALPRAHPLASRRRVTPQQMAGLPIVGYRARSSTRRRVMSVLGPLGAELRYEVDGRAAALRFVSLGLGAAFLSLLPGHRIDSRVVVVRDVSRHFPASRFWLCRRPRRAPTDIERAATKALRKHARRRRD